MTFPDRNQDPPDACDVDTCSNCGRAADRELTATMFACSLECERVLCEQWCSDCHANVAEGDDHSLDCSSYPTWRESWDEERDLCTEAAE